MVNAWSGLKEVELERTRKTLVASKAPQLPACRCNLTEAAGDEQYDYNRNHNGGTSLIACSVVEDLDKRLDVSRFENLFDITGAEG